jgi:hypothetical protein
MRNPFLIFLESMRVAHNKVILLLYRAFALVTLYGILALVLGYAVYMGFYAMNTSWVAPTIISPTNDKILDLTSKIVTSEQTLAVLTVDRDHQMSSLGEMKGTVTALQALDSKFQVAIAEQSKSNKVDGPELSQLDNRKKIDNTKTSEVVAQLAIVEAQVDKDLKNGLITKVDAASAKATINQARTTATDSEITEVMLRDSMRQKTSTHFNTVDALAKEAELKGNIVQLQILIHTGEMQLTSDLVQIKQLESAIALAQDSPYFLATKGKVQFAFVPYANASNAKVGAKVYDCYLSFIACRYVGTVVRVFNDEEVINHPVFKTAIRGTLTQLDLKDPEAGKDATLFFGHKPFLF